MKQKKQKTPRVTARCRKCIYRTWLGGGRTLSHLACYYVVLTKEPRGCPAGDQCTKYVKGPALESKNENKRW